MIVPPDAAPAYVETIGTPAPIEVLPELTVETWWPDDPESTASTLRNAREWLVAAQTQSGWTALCTAATAAAGSERSLEAPELGALACSDDATVTRLQLFAALVLRLVPETQGYLDGSPGSSKTDFESTLAQIRVECTAGFASRMAATAEVAAACALPGAGLTPTGLVEQSAGVYRGLATRIATMDPTVDSGPVFFPGADAD